MGFFTVGNLITLGIVLLILVFFRHTDRNSRNLKVLRDYSEKLKKELNSFVQEQEKAVKDYSVSLGVEKESAKELMKRLQLTEDELAKKAAAVANIDKQIKNHENALAELDRMTDRVQENMNRIRDESDFVETTGKRLSEVKAKLEEMVNRFERETAVSLANTADAVVASVKSTVSDLSATAETIERQVEDHREAVNKIEQTRAANMARDLEHINNVLKAAIEQAGKRAGKIEDAALSKLKDQAEERLLRLKAAEEEKLRSYQESAKARVLEVQNLLKGLKDEWRSERSEMETSDKTFREERRKEVLEIKAQFDDSKKQIIEAQKAIEVEVREFTSRSEELVSSREASLRTLFSDSEKHFNAEFASLKEQVKEHTARTTGIVSSQEASLRTLFSDSEKHFNAEFASLKEQMKEHRARTTEIVSSQEGLLITASEEMKQKALEITGTKLEEYRQAQDAEFKRLATLADDARKLDAELRQNMQEVITKIKDDFSRYERESADLRKTEVDKFSRSASDIKEEMVELEKELAALKTAAYENVSEKLKIFEDEFFADLTNKSGEIDKRFLQWQENIETKLSVMGDEAETARRVLESNFTDEMRKRLSAQDERLVAELEHLKAETRGFEEEIRGHMNVADESVSSFKEQMDRSFEEARKDAEISLRSEFGKHALATAETLKQYHRELDEARSANAAKIRELDDNIEETRRRLRDLAAEADTRLTGVRSSVEDAERHIREAVDQTKLIDKAEEFRLAVERRIEDLKGDMDRLDQRRAEVAQLENDFIKIKRLEDDVNAKMSRFISGKHKIETMEADFNRLLQISRAVEEKLTQVTVSDDVLQGIQLQIRKLEEALTSAEDKYHRIERKGQILDNTNDGIDRNFKVLQESEKLSVKIGSELDRYAEDLKEIKTSIETLSGESEKAREAVDRVDELNTALEEIDQKINAMQRARQWIADAETRFEELNKQAQIQARTIDSLVKGKKSGPPVNLGEGAPSLQKKENVIALLKQGWTEKEIAKSLKLSLGEVQLIREMSSRDI